VVVRAPEFIRNISKVKSRASERECVCVILEVHGAGKLRAIDNALAALSTSLRAKEIEPIVEVRVRLKWLRMADSHQKVWMGKTAERFRFVMSSAFDSSVRGQTSSKAGRRVDKRTTHSQ
jgi:hypothetical protein